MDPHHPRTPQILKKLGVKYVIVHGDRYEMRENRYEDGVVGESPELDKRAEYRFVRSFGEDLVYTFATEESRL